jgi:hypothetical protein
MKSMSEESSLSLHDNSSGMYEEQETDPQDSDDNDPSRLGKRKEILTKPPLNPNRRSSAPGALSLPSQSKVKKTTPPRANAVAPVSRPSNNSPFDAGRLSIIGGNENTVLPSPKGSPIISAPFESDSPDFGDDGGYGDDDQLVDTPFDYEEQPPLSPADGRHSTTKRSPVKSVLETKKVQSKSSPTLRLQSAEGPKKHVRHSIIPESDEEEEEAFQSPARPNHRRISFASTIMDTPASDEFPVGRQVDDDSYSEPEDGELSCPSLSVCLSVPLSVCLSLSLSLSLSLLPHVCLFIDR